jgi:hypothetical protein
LNGSKPANEFQKHRIFQRIPERAYDARREVGGVISRISHLR